MAKGVGSGTGIGGMCATCALPAELCVCETLSTEGTALRVRLDTRRYGKAVTVIEGFEDDQSAKALGKELKHGLSTGGTAKERRVELQGDQAEKARRFLAKKGYLID